ncbi:unnamed protein product, partial [Discosporangium mesarthrocarpum]
MSRPDIMNSFPFPEHGSVFEGENFEGQAEFEEEAATVRRTMTAKDTTSIHGFGGKGHESLSKNKTHTQRSWRGKDPASRSRAQGINGTSNGISNSTSKGRK